MPEWDDEDEGEPGTGVLTETKKKVDKPPLFKVLLHNDDYTTMEFVVFILKSIFHKSEPDAVKIMLAVHEQGVGIAGVYTFEIAEAKVSKVIDLARQSEYPLLCTVEAE